MQRAKKSNKGKKQSKNKEEKNPNFHKRKRTNKKNIIKVEEVNEREIDDIHEERVAKKIIGKSSLNSLRADLTGYLSNFINLYDLVKLLNLNRRIRLITLNRVKIISPFINFRNSLKMEKIKTEVDLLNQEKIQKFYSFLNDKNQNFSDKEKESLIYATLKSLSTSKKIELSTFDNSIFTFYKNILTSDFSVCENLVLYMSRINEDILKNLSQIILVNTSIKELYLKDSYSVDLTIFINSLEFNRNIKILNYSSCSYDEEIKRKNFSSLFSIIQRSKTIEKFRVNLDKIETDSQVYSAMTSMIENNKSLKYMKLKYYHADARSYEFSYLRKNDTIESLDLSYNPLKVTAIKSLYLNLSLQPLTNSDQILIKINTLILRNI